MDKALDLLAFTGGDEPVIAGSNPARVALQYYNKHLHLWGPASLLALGPVA